MADDPYKYFRIEAREILDGVGTGVLALEKGEASEPRRATVGRLLRFAHTLKGAARVVRLPEIAEHAHAIEDVLAPFREGDGDVPRDSVTALLRLVDAIETSTKALDPVVARAPLVHTADAVDTPAAPSAPATDTIETVRVEIDEMDRLLDGVTEARVLVTALERETAGLDRAQRLAQLVAEQLSPQRLGDLGAPAAAATIAKIRNFAEDLRTSLAAAGRTVASGVAQVATELAEIQDAANRLRLLPASHVFIALERATRDAASAVDKRVRFRATGGDVRLDAHVLVILRDALLHIVTNAVVHGIEPADARVAAGKFAEGRVDVDVVRRGHKIAFTCRDDGRGVDVEALRRAAVSGGMRTEREAAGLDHDALLRLMLEGGVTTANTVTNIAGRGIGLDVARDAAARLKGNVTIASRRGRGTDVEICVPMSLTSLPALLVEAAGLEAAVPLDAVRRTIRLEDADIDRKPEGATVMFDGREIRFVPLSYALRTQAFATRPNRRWTVVVVEDNGKFAAIGVERLCGTTDVVMRAVPAHACADPTVAGASFDAEGNPLLVVDASGLIAVAYATTPPPPAKRPARRFVLVIDDSLTTRMLEQSILESAGYDVEVATSAEEGLVKAREARHDLFLVDVEMPGMNGFEFVAATRADPELRATPAILVTSRGDPEDKRRGRDAGASAYIVKGDFDQAVLLDAIRGLVGAAR